MSTPDERDSPQAVALTAELGLVEQLREAGNDYTIAWGSGELYDEAADEIERLNGALRSIHSSKTIGDARKIVIEVMARHLMRDFQRQGLTDLPDPLAAPLPKSLLRR